MDWDRVRVFLAVARCGQILGAARVLRLNHATVGRQLSALEKEVNAQLVQRHTDGCHLTQAGNAMLEVAERVESEFLKFEAGISGISAGTRGTVRVGAPDGIGNYFLATSFGEFARSHPEILVQLVPLPRTFSLSRREADIAIVLDRPAHGNLIIQKLTDYSVGLYGATEYLARNPPIRSEDDLVRHVFITYVDDLVYTPALDYGRKLGSRMPLRFECGSTVGQMEATRAGHGIAMLHDYAAQRFSNLRPILPHMRFIRTYWMISHPDTHNSYRVAEVRRHITSAVHGAASSFVNDARRGKRAVRTVT